MKKTKAYKDRWAVVQIYNEDDGAQPLVHIVDVFDRKPDAKKALKAAAEELLDLFNDGVPPEERAKFDDVWEKVDNHEEDEFEDLGYDPVEDTVCWRLRIRWFTEPKGR